MSIRKPRTAAELLVKWAGGSLIIAVAYRIACAFLPAGVTP